MWNNILLCALLITVPLTAVATNAIAQEKRKTKFSAWEASYTQDMMTDKIQNVELVAGEVNGKADLIISCDSNRVIRLSFLMAYAYGDSASTVRWRFDQEPANAPESWNYKVARHKPLTRNVLEDATSRDHNVRELANLMLKLQSVISAIPELTMISADAAKARHLVKKGINGSILRVEITPGRQRLKSPLQLRYSLIGLTKALAWANCTP